MFGCRADVLCSLHSPDLSILFWFFMCFGYIVYSYISPSLFLSCSFASFCSSSKFHKVSLFLFLLFILESQGSSGTCLGGGVQAWLGKVLPAPNWHPAVTVCLCVCLPVFVSPVAVPMGVGAQEGHGLWLAASNPILRAGCPQIPVLPQQRMPELSWRTSQPRCWMEGVIVLLWL